MNGRRHQPISSLAAATLLLLAPASATGRRWYQGHCYYELKDVANAPRFEDFPTHRPTVMHPARPILATADARLYRTVIRDAAAEGPNFAGDFTIVRWGCGSACVDWTILSARTGRMFFAEDLRMLVNLRGLDERLTYWPDSRLLVLVGMPREDAAREGILFLEWTGRALRRLRYVPVRELCPS